MTESEIKVALIKATRRCWPDVSRASELPFPDYWKAVTGWLTFHAPHVGDLLMWKFIDGFAVSAKEAEERGEAPTPPRVPKEVREIWAHARRSAAVEDIERRRAWENSAQRAMAVRDRFATRRVVQQNFVRDKQTEGRTK